MYLGMGIGTAGVKAVFVDEAGAMVATASRELARSHPAPLWSELDPDAWFETPVGRVDDLASACRCGRPSSGESPIPRLKESLQGNATPKFSASMPERGQP